MRGSKIELVLDHDDVGKDRRARRQRSPQRQRLVGDIAHGEAAELPPGRGIDQGGDEGRVEASLLGQALPRGRAFRHRDNCEANEGKTEKQGSSFQGKRQSGAVQQSRGRRQNERDASEQNAQHCTRVLQDEERDRAGQGQRQIGNGQLERAVIEFHHRHAGNRQRQHAGEQNRSLEIPDEHQQQGGIEEQGRDRKWKVFDAAFGQRDDADHSRKEQGQNNQRRLLSMSDLFLT